MDSSSYVELHCHSAFSFLDGASQPDELVSRAAELGYSSLAITDHDGIHGALEFAQFAEASGIRPITGAEVTLVDDSHLTLLAETPTGYANLCRLLTHVHHGRHPAPVAVSDENETPSLTPESGPSFGDHADGLILLTGCRQGQLSQAIDAGDITAAKRILAQYIEWFGKDQVFVELQHNEVFGDTARIRALVDLANTMQVRYVATGNVHYHVSSRHRLQDVLVAIRARSTLDQCHRERRPNARFALPSHEEMHRRFAEWPDAIASTQVIADRCASFILPRDLSYTFPGYDTGNDETPDETLARICWEAFEARYSNDDQKAIGKLRDELRLIGRHKLAGFFLLYRDLLELADEVAAELRGGPVSGSRRFLPPGRGRGSSVSSIVCYLIGLSPVDPLAHDLYVGRFLNEDRPGTEDGGAVLRNAIARRCPSRQHIGAVAILHAKEFGESAGLINATATVPEPVDLLKSNDCSPGSPDSLRDILQLAAGSPVGFAPLIR